MWGTPDFVATGAIPEILSRPGDHKLIGQADEHGGLRQFASDPQAPQAMPACSRPGLNDDAGGGAGAAAVCLDGGCGVQFCEVICWSGCGCANACLPACLRCFADDDCHLLALLDDAVA